MYKASQMIISYEGLKEKEIQITLKTYNDVPKPQSQVKVFEVFKIKVLHINVN